MGGCLLATKYRSSLEMGADLGLDHPARDCANHLIYPLPPSKKQKGGDAPDTKTDRRLGVLINVQFGNSYLSSVLLRQLFKDRCNHTAGGAPLCPKINNGQFLTVNDPLVEIRIGYSDDVFGHHVPLGFDTCITNAESVSEADDNPGFLSCQVSVLALSI